MGQFGLSMPYMEGAEGGLEGGILLFIEIGEFVKFRANLIVQPVVQQTNDKFTIGATGKGDDTQHEYGRSLEAHSWPYA